MKKWYVLPAIALALTGLLFITACPNDSGGGGPGSGSGSVDTTGLEAAIKAAYDAKNGVKEATSPSEVAQGVYWVTAAVMKNLNDAIGTAETAKQNAASQAAVDRAKTTLEVTTTAFIAAKSEGTYAAITLGGTVTVKNNGQTVPYLLIMPHDRDWTWQEQIIVSSSAANSPWSIITRPFAVETEIFFRVQGYQTESGGTPLFNIDVKNISVRVRNTGKTDINIDLANLSLVTLSGTINVSYDGKPIPSMEIQINRKSDDMYLGGTGSLYNVGNNTPWSIKVEPLAVETDVVFHIVGSGSRDTWSESDRLFVFWGQDFGVRVRNQNVSNIAIKFITISGTINIKNYVNTVQVSVGADYFVPGDRDEYGGQRYIWLTGKDLYPPFNNQKYSGIVPLFPSPKNNIKAWVHFRSGETWLGAYEKEYMNVTGNITDASLDIDMNGDWINSGGYNPTPNPQPPGGGDWDNGGGGGGYNPPGGGGGTTGPGVPVPNPGTGGTVWTVVPGNFSALDYANTIGYGNGKFIAGADCGSLAYSTDGITWTAVANSTFSKTTSLSGYENVQKIAWGNGKFVAVATNGAMAYSSDGITWAAVANSTFGSGILSYIKAIAWGNGKFVAVGTSVAYSPDGVTWTAVTNHTFGTTPIQAIAYGNGKFVAAGGGKMAYSSDGITWSAVANSPFSNLITVNSIACDNGKFVAVGFGQWQNGGKIAYSSDGITWTAVAENKNPFYYPYTQGDEYNVYADSAANIRAVAYGNGKFVAVSYGGKTAVSSDGSTWTVVAETVFGREYLDGTVSIAYGNNKFVAIAADGRFAYWNGN
jgi:hypothetical protein